MLSWNIQMLPNSLALFSKALRKKQHIRAPWIITHCLAKDYEVIVFQEVFDKNIQRKLKAGLRKKYPYQVDPEIAKGRLTSNGILIVSRLPMFYIDHVIYPKGAHEDAWAAKGCTLVEVEKEGAIFQIAGTHLQSGNSAAAKKHRSIQYKAIKTLLDNNRIDSLPALVIGDMNTRKSNQKAYREMIEVLDVQDFPLDEEEPFTVDGKNSWNEHTQGIQLDYVLLQARLSSTTIHQQQLLRLKRLRKGKLIDVADHYGIIAEIWYRP